VHRQHDTGRRSHGAQPDGRIVVAKRSVPRAWTRPSPVVFRSTGRRSMRASTRGKELPRRSRRQPQRHRGHPAARRRRNPGAQLHRAQTTRPPWCSSGSPHGTVDYTRERTASGSSTCVRPPRLPSTAGRILLRASAAMTRRPMALSMARTIPARSLESGRNARCHLRHPGLRHLASRLGKLVQPNGIGRAG